VGPFVSGPLGTLPVRSNREGPIPGIGATKTATGDYAGTSGTVQNKIRLVRRDTAGSVALDAGETTDVDATDASLDNRGAFRLRVFAQHPIEISARDVEAWTLGRGDRVLAGPSRNVSRVGMKPGRVNGVELAEMAKQFPRAPRQRLCKARLRTVAMDEDNRSAPGRKESRGCGSCGTAAHNDGVSTHDITLSLRWNSVVSGVRGHHLQNL
jgi:hypothetical protein